MKKLVSFLTATALVVTLMTTSSCTKTCDAGYEGSDCKTQVRTKFVNTYTASETKNAGTPYTYPTSITAGTSATDITQVIITKITGQNLGTGGFFTNYVTGTVSGSTLTIANQSPDGDGYYITGSGTITGTTVALTYSISGPNNATPPVTVTDNYITTLTH
ncbi:MAG: hypothetical protein JWO03_2785 [Bacteroidetes bacterium]|nr:hypothetical protein [Bacteroidota bacterium]